MRQRDRWGWRLACWLGASVVAGGDSVFNYRLISMVSGNLVISISEAVQKVGDNERLDVRGVEGVA